MKVKVFTRNVTSSVPGGFENIISRYFEEDINKWLSEVNIQLVSIQLTSAPLTPTSIIIMCMLFYKELSPAVQNQQIQPNRQSNDNTTIER